MGAAIAQRLAVTRPELVKGLILARPAWVDEEGPDNLAPNLEVGRLLGAYPPDEAALRFASSGTAARLQAEAPDNLASLSSFFTREPVAVTASLLRAVSADGPGTSAAQIASISVPTLVIGHERDAIHPLATAQKLADLIPQSHLVEITPKATSLDRYREDFARALKIFLKEFER